jgi:hypothetical protein
VLREGIVCGVDLAVPTGADSFAQSVAMREGFAEHLEASEVRRGCIDANTRRR